MPLRVITTGGNVNDVSTALDLVDGIAPVAGRRGRPRRRPDALLADTGYDSHRLRRELARRRIVPIISYRGTRGVKGLAKPPYVPQTFVIETATPDHPTTPCYACSFVS